MRMVWLLVIAAILQLLPGCIKGDREQKAVTGAGSSVSPPKRTATIDIERFGELVPGHSGHALAIATLDTEAYDSLYESAESKPTRFKEELEKGTCILIPDGTEVEVKYRHDAPVWWRIRYEGRDWWIVGAFMKDKAGVEMGLNYKGR